MKNITEFQFENLIFELDLYIKISKAYIIKYIYIRGFSTIITKKRTDISVLHRICDMHDVNYIFIFYIYILQQWVTTVLKIKNFHL